METLGVDFDGVIRRFPKFAEWFANFISHDDLLIRARLYWLRNLLCNVCFNYAPIILDGLMIDSINQWDGRIVIITGRETAKKFDRAFAAVKGKVDFDVMYGRDTKESEEAYKYRIIKKENVSVYIEDRDLVIRYLRKRGVDAISVKEVRECYRR